MTPGYAKTRRELPWLPYPLEDQVYVINSHNFGGGSFSPAVNGKMPIAAWIPSRDTDGNGTTTLTDLVGSNNGTLTNMDPATDWVADTGAGGVRALDFDGVNDQVLFGSVIPIGTAISASLWVYLRSAGDQNIIRCRNGSTDRFGVGYSFGYLEMGIFNGTYESKKNIESSGGWLHVVFTWNGSATTAWINNVEATTRAFVNAIVGASNGLTLSGEAASATTKPLDGMLDDIRIFDQSLNATDAADLFASGLGRGVDAS